MHDKSDEVVYTVCAYGTPPRSGFQPLALPAYYYYYLLLLY